MKMGGNTPAAASGQLSDPPVSDRPSTPGQKPLERRPAAKTSPSIRVGETVIFRTQDTAKQHNGSKDHPAIVTRDNGGSQNLKVLPDCGAPYDATSQVRISAADESGSGWFSIGEKQAPTAGE